MRDLLLWMVCWFVFLGGMCLLVGRFNGRRNYDRRMRERMWEVQFRTSFIWENQKQQDAETMRKHLRLTNQIRAFGAAVLLLLSVSACQQAPQTDTAPGGVLYHPADERPRVTLADVKRFSRQLRAGIEASAVVVLTDPRLTPANKAKGEQALIAVRAADDEVQALTENDLNARAIAKAMLSTSMAALPLIPMKDSTRGYVTLAIAGLSAFVTLAPDIKTPAAPVPVVAPTPAVPAPAPAPVPAVLPAPVS